MFRNGYVHLLIILLVGCTKAGANDEFADEERGDTEAGEDEIGTDDTSSGDTSGGDCELDEYISDPIYNHPPVDWAHASGMVSHAVTRGVVAPGQWIDTVLVTESGADDSMLCVEWLVADGDLDIDACNVFYTQGVGVGGGWPADGFVELAVDSVTFDIGDGPVALETWPGTESIPTQQHGSLPAPPDGVPFGGTATLAVTFTDLPALDLVLDVPEDIMPIVPALGSATLGSEELASWTWSNSGGTEPIELRIEVSSTPFGAGPEQVRIRCLATDDGEFAFPSEYFDLARERLGSDEIHAGARITRGIEGQVPLAGAELHWHSSNEVLLGVAIVD